MKERFLQLLSDLMSNPNYHGSIERRLVTVILILAHFTLLLDLFIKSLIFIVSRSTKIEDFLNSILPFINVLLLAIVLSGILLISFKLSSFFIRFIYKDS
jgi:hypothetical protein